VLQESVNLRVLEERVKILKGRVESGKKLESMIDEENLAALEAIQTNGEVKISLWKNKIKELHEFSNNLAVRDSSETNLQHKSTNS
jgi:hypothetical protein